MTTEPYVPTENEIRECATSFDFVWDEDGFDRAIDKVKADALREWANFQQSALDVSGHALDSDEWSTARAWIGDARAYAMRIEGESRAT